MQKLLFAAVVLVLGATVVASEPCEEPCVNTLEITLSPNGEIKIQDAIDAGCAMIWLTDGRYYGDRNRDLRFGGRPVTVESVSHDPGSCYIDCQASPGEQHRGFIFESEDGSQAFVHAIGIRNAYVDGSGGAIDCDDASVRIACCEFRNNYATRGGAISLRDDSDCDISGCLFELNGHHDGARTTSGGGLYCSNSDPKIMNCVFRANRAYEGAGAAVHGTDGARFLGCRFIYNRGINEGGGLLSCSSKAHVEYCKFLGNTAPEGGGLMLGIWSGNSKIIKCVFDGNEALHTADNVGDGAALWVRRDSWGTVIEHCTFTLNRSGNANAGVVFSGSQRVRIEKTIIAYNPLRPIVSAEDTTPQLKCCDLWWNDGATSLQWRDYYSDQKGKDGNCTVNPHFCHRHNGYEGAGQEFGDLQLNGNRDCEHCLCGNEKLRECATWTPLDPDDGTREGFHWPIGALLCVECYTPPAKRIPEEGGCSIELSRAVASSRGTAELSIDCLPGAMTQIRYTVMGQNGAPSVQLCIYDAVGRLVRTLVDCDVVAGTYDLVWDGKNEKGELVASGVYFCRLWVNGEGTTKRAVVLR